MIILGARRPMIEEACEEATIRAPRLWAHAREMQNLRALNAIDRETFQMMVQTIGPRWKTFQWISSIPLAVASLVQYESKGEVFGDMSGKALFKFLERNPQYKVPKGQGRVSVSFS